MKEQTIMTTIFLIENLKNKLHFTKNSHRTKTTYFKSIIFIKDCMISQNIKQKAEDTIDISD